MGKIRVRERVEEIGGFCDVEVPLVVLGGKWKLAILKLLLDGPLRFGELRRGMPGVTQRMLTRQLRELEEDGLLLRAVYAEVPPRTEYSLTLWGESLKVLVRELESWGGWYRGRREEPSGP
ncbi:winged helix-turn-helix transcriptional regulator [Amycolatopsis sp. H20-H5]|uniref:winged helix-turn-helix transcriptional regulator n=1 Tax=Amycolatopsis sp. H20-H5 TaxID=3046309 RepID=UPI002DBF294D|nr:helix-turn-helix domain-containing protein [Amycolatopsis sp. H20-H5]MEC3981267.1 helix-turn-helix domain-containing protein [Amycolatopsis sp. H20-H5]